ncbi:MAG: asparagine synthase (glutamine-hydrolyzing) [Methylophilaceae bacterium]|nr:asparagine synthase (glutamine-hydrolyzing) [Methylophilaceae bacterium]
MCGILGWVTTDSSDKLEYFEQALDVLTHRGPDDSGIFDGQGILLGHRRLSIIDLSSAGHQPMRDDKSGAAIVFNGEIYNYLELREELKLEGHVFLTESDTEVLLRAYLEWGASALNKLNGMWAFAIWDPTKQSVFIARDRFGIKPFYYTDEINGFAFASEPKALLELFPELRKPDDIAVYKFLAEGLLYTDERSFYDGINTLPPGHFAEYQIETKQFRLTKYWDYPDASVESEPLNRQEAVNEFSNLFNDAVALRDRSDVPVGITLSGGLDSTAVLAALMQQSIGERSCFTSVYGGKDKGEAGWAKVATQPYGERPIEVEASKAGWIDTLQKISWHMDAPGYSPAVYPLWHLMQEAREKGVYVLLEGQGADEALGGYPQYAMLSLLGMVKKTLSWAGVKGAFQSWNRLCGTFTSRWVILWFLRELFPGLVKLNRRRAGAYMTLSRDFKTSVEKKLKQKVPRKKREFSYDQVTQRLYQDHSSNILPGLLHYADAISMAHSVESRLPFMDYRLVEWMFRHGESLKIYEGQTKWVLRKYLNQVGQNKIAERQDKLGYPTPVESWLAENNGAMVRNLLLSPESQIKRYCDKEGIEKLLNRHLSGRTGAGSHLYRLISTELWMRSCL